MWPDECAGPGSGQSLETYISHAMDPLRRKTGIQHLGLEGEMAWLHIKGEGSE